MRRRALLQTGMALTASPSLAQSAARTLRIGMTTSDLPTTGGDPDNGSEGGRFAAIPARAPWPEGSKLFGNPIQHYTYDPDKARRLLTEAGDGPVNPLRLKVQIPTAGSGNMVPLPMGEFVQQSYKEIAVEVEYDMVGWGIMLTNMRKRPDAPGAPLSGLYPGDTCRITGRDCGE
jgi:hypothetical protein